MSKDSGKDKKAKKDALRWVLSYLGPHKGIFIPSLVALFLTAGLSLSFPLLLKDLIGNPADAWRNGINAADVLAKSNQTAKLMAALLALQAFIGFWRVQGFIRSVEGALNDLRRDIFRHLVKLPVPFFQNERSGAVSNRVFADLGVVRETFLTTLPQAIRQTVILIGGLTMILLFSWKLSLVMLATIPVVVLAVALFGRKVRRYSKEAQDALAESGSVIEETVQNIADVKSFANEPLERNRYDSALATVLNVSIKGSKVRGAFLSFIIFAMFGAITFVTWYGSRMLANGEIDSTAFTAFIVFSIFVGASLGSFPEIITQFQTTSVAAERLHTIMAEAPETDGGQPVGTLMGSLDFDQVEFLYPSRPDSPVLRDLSFSVSPGQRVAIVGPSGAGKSTIFSLILGFHRPQSGRVRFDGKDAATLDLAGLRKQLAVVPQEVLLFGGSIHENIAYGRPGASLEEIKEAAKKANAHEFIASLEQGYETTVGPRGVKLSGGQRQRIAIARAILADPKILLLDEATSALDSESERLVNEALERLMQDRTSLVIAHRLSTVRHADRILVVNHGRIVESGSHEELLALGGTYKLLAETQLS